MGDFGGMIHPIVLFPDDRLTTVCSPVVDFNQQLHELVEDLFSTMYHNDGVGLAAPQIGVLQRVFVMDCREGKKPFNPVAFINPEILVKLRPSSDEEGCLSMPGLFLNIWRPSFVSVASDGLDGATSCHHYRGLESRVILHEYDHTQGVLMTHRAAPEEIARQARETAVAGL